MRAVCTKVSFLFPSPSLPPPFTLLPGVGLLFVSFVLTKPQ